MVVIIFAEEGQIQSNDDGSGASSSLQVYRSSPNEVRVGPYCFPYYFGQVATDGRPAKVLRACFTDPNDFRPVGWGVDTWEQIWTDWGSHKKSDYTLWGVKDSAIPSGYKCLSRFFFQRADGRPAPTADQVKGMVYVADHLCSLVDPDSYAQGWTDRGTGAHGDLSLFYSSAGVGYLAYKSYNSTPPTPSVDYTLAFWNPNDCVRLAQSWEQLKASVLGTVSASLFPQKIAGDRYVLSVSQSKLDAVYAGNAENFKKYTSGAIDCEDFATEMRAAVARSGQIDPISYGLQAGGFCGTVYLIPKAGGPGRGMNIHLQPIGTILLFDPQNGQHVYPIGVLQDYTVEGVYF